MAARFPLVAGCPLMLRTSRLTPEAAIVGKSSKTPTPARRMRDRLARGRADSQPRRGRRDFLNRRLARGARNDEEDMQLVCTNATPLVHEVALELCLQPESTFGST